MNLPNRRSTDFAYRLPEPLERYYAHEVPETRITGQRQRWPVDPEFTRRLANLEHAPKKGPLPIWAPALAIALLVAAAYGLVLLFASIL